MKLILYVKEVEDSNIKEEDNHNKIDNKINNKIDISIFDEIIEKLVNVKIIRL